MKQEWTLTDVDNLLNTSKQVRRALRRIGSATESTPPTFKDALAVVVFLNAAQCSIDAMCKALGLTGREDDEEYD